MGLFSRKKTKQESDAARKRPDVWVEGEVLACACPQCSAPMSIRTWLMMADCWRCGVSIELSEEQEREALKLLEELEVAKREQEPSPEPTPPRKITAAKPPQPQDDPARHRDPSDERPPPERKDWSVRPGW